MTALPAIQDRPARRLVLKAGLLAGGGLLLGLRLPSLMHAAEAATGTVDFAPNAFLKISKQDVITLILPHVEFGQGALTSAAMLMGEELEVGLDQVVVEMAPPDLSKYIDPLLYDQATGGSTSTRTDWVRLREAAATARSMLVAAAASRWGVSPSSCRVARGVISHEPSGRQLSYGAVADDAARQGVPTGVMLKAPSEFKLIGTSAKRLDGPSKVNGTAVYGIDTKLPGLRFGTLAITPVKGGRVLRMQTAQAKAVPGVQDVIQTADGSAVAVTGVHMWAAMQGLQALNIEWSPGPNGGVTLAAIVSSMERASLGSAVVAVKKGDAAVAIKGSVTTVSAVYQSPFLSHSPMEPLNCTLLIQPDRAEIWVGTQVPVRAQAAVAAETGLPISRVFVNSTLMGGGFGRGLEENSVRLAAAIAKQVHYPVKLVWTREEDMRHDNYRPYYYDRVVAGLDAQGGIVGRTHRVTGPSILARWAPPAFKDGLDSDAVESAAETPYEMPAELVDYVRHEPDGLVVSWWRGVGATHNVFVVESFIDELAAAGRRDPVEFRRSMLANNPRALAVLNLAAEQAGWGDSLPPRTGRGIALQFAFGSYLAGVVEVEVSVSGEVKLKRAVMALDCGMVVNPDTIRAQLEGGLILGLGTALYNQITVTDGAVEQGNFDTYRALRINEAPKIEVHQISSSEKPGGVGETGTAIAAGALGNAIFAATGQRLRTLPFDGQLKRA